MRGIPVVPLLVLLLAAGGGSAAPPTGTARLRFTVRGPDGPAPGASVSVGWVGHAATGADGSFRLGGLDEGPVAVAVRAPGFAAGTVEALAGAEDLEIRLTREVPCEIRTLDAAGAPVPRVRIVLRDAEHLRPAVHSLSGSDGVARFSVPPGEWRLTATRPWSTSAERSVELLREHPPGRTDLVLR